jgi:S1-C subfamily serine protease
MVKLTGQFGVPVIVINNQPVVGFNRERIRELLTSGDVSQKPVHFGLKIADAAKIAPQMGNAPVSGAIIGEVIPGFLGEKAGLKEGDIITGINNVVVQSAADMERALATLQPGNIVTILFLRSGETRKSEIII